MDLKFLKAITIFLEIELVANSSGLDFDLEDLSTAIEIV
jgi:hypothetical protein